MNGIESAFTGIVAAAPDLKTSKAGKRWCAFLVRVGEGDVAQWVRVVAFEQMAEIAVSLDKGASVYVEGRLTLNSWTAHDGNERHGLSVAASRVLPLGLIGRRKPGAASRADRPAQAAAGRSSPAPATDGASLNDPLPF